MSTRGAIARPQGEGFVGRYHHWDSYPTALGATLFELRNGIFGGDTEAMLDVLIDQHPAGWSTINNKDFARTPGFRGRGSDSVPCVEVIGGEACGKPVADHLCQTYGPQAHAGQYPCGADYANHIGHRHVPDRVIEAYMALIPECYCHGDRAGDEHTVTAEDASGSGCEFAYVLEGPRMLVLGSYHQDGGKAVGMFGMGDPEASWKILAEVDMDNDAMTPEAWKDIEQVAWPDEEAA